MITVTKTIMWFEDGTRRTDKSHFPVADMKDLERRRRQDQSRYGCERVIYHYYKNEGEEESC